ncbi:MAG: hypothetical protein WDN26_08945 [Chitinophagaceae bacterium]
MNTKLFFLLLIFIHGFAAYGQTKLKKDTATVNAINSESRTLAASDSAKAIHLATQAREIASEIKYRKGEANALKYIGNGILWERDVWRNAGLLSQSLKVFESAGDDIGISNMLNNIGAIYLNQGADDKHWSIFLNPCRSRKNSGDTLRMYSALTNVGSIYHNKRDPAALNYLLKAVPLVEGRR